MRIFKKIFGAKTKEVPQPLAVDGIPPAPITMEPDDAELAAQALLETMSAKKRRHRDKAAGHNGGTTPPQDNDHEKTAGYYRALVDRIREAQQVSVLRTTRYIAFCEQELKNKHLPLHGKDSVAQMECELYKRIDVVEHIGGELKRRWQHCLAEVTVRLMEETDNTREVE